MKSKTLIKLAESHGWYLLRNGANHDIYTNGKKNVAIPRHRELNEITAMKIKKEMGL